MQWKKKHWEKHAMQECFDFFRRLNFPVNNFLDWMYFSLFVKQALSRLWNYTGFSILYCLIVKHQANNSIESIAALITNNALRHRKSVKKRFTVYSVVSLKLGISNAAVILQASSQRMPRMYVLSIVNHSTGSKILECDVGFSFFLKPTIFHMH